MKRASCAVVDEDIGYLLYGVMWGSWLYLSYRCSLWVLNAAN